MFALDWVRLRFRLVFVLMCSLYCLYLFITFCMISAVFLVAYCSRALRPSQRRYCATKREMLAAVAMYIQFRSYLRGAKFTLRTDHKSLVWLHRFKDTEGMMARWLHATRILTATVSLLDHTPAG